MVRIGIAVAALVGSEGLGRLVDPRLGVSLFAALAVVLPGLAVITLSLHERRLLVGLSVVAIARLLAMTMPLAGVDRIWWYPAVGLPVGATLILASRRVAYTWRDLGISPRGVWRFETVAMAVLGVAAGVLAYPLLGTAAPLNPVKLAAAPLAAVALALSVGVIEEVLFRGFLQRAAIDRFGSPRGILLVTFLYAAVAADRWSIPVVGAVTGLSLLFTLVTVFTGSVIPAVVGHATFAVVVLMVAPFFGAPGVM